MTFHFFFWIDDSTLVFIFIKKNTPIRICPNRNERNYYNEYNLWFMINIMPKL